MRMWLCYQMEWGTNSIYLYSICNTSRGTDLDTIDMEMCTSGGIYGLEVRHTNSYRYTEVEVEVEQLWWQVEVSM